MARTLLIPVIQAAAYHTSINRISYLVSVNVLWLALGPIIWAPLCDTYGRRPVYLAAMLVTLVSSIACAVAKTYGVQVFTRVCKQCMSDPQIFPADICTDASGVWRLWGHSRWSREHRRYLLSP